MLSSYLRTHSLSISHSDHLHKTTVFVQSPSTNFQPKTPSFSATPSSSKQFGSLIPIGFRSIYPINPVLNRLVHDHGPNEDLFLLSPSIDAVHVISTDPIRTVSTNTFTLSSFANCSSCFFLLFIDRFTLSVRYQNTLHSNSDVIHFNDWLNDVNISTLSSGLSLRSARNSAINRFNFQSNRISPSSSTSEISSSASSLSFDFKSDSESDFDFESPSFWGSVTFGFQQIANLCQCSTHWTTRGVLKWLNDALSTSKCWDAEMLTCWK